MLRISVEIELFYAHKYWDVQNSLYGASLSTGSLEGTTRLNKMKTTFSHILLQSCHQLIENGLTKRLNTKHLMFIPKIKM